MNDGALRYFPTRSFIFYLVLFTIVEIYSSRSSLYAWYRDIYRERQAGVGVLPPHEGPEPG